MLDICKAKDVVKLVDGLVKMRSEIFGKAG